jgi:hypothetical protein
MLGYAKKTRDEPNLPNRRILLKHKILMGV